MSVRRWLVKNGLPLTRSAPAPDRLIVSKVDSNSRSPEIFSTVICRPSARPAATTSESSGSVASGYDESTKPAIKLGRRDQIAEQFEPLHIELRASEKCHAGEIILRLIDALNQTSFDRVFAGDEHDGNSLGGGACCLHSVDIADDHRHSATDQIGHHCRQTIKMI